MDVTRRTVSLGLLAAGLPGCASGQRIPVLASSSAQGAPSRATAPPPKPTPDSGYDAWVRAFRGRAASKGISTATLDAAFRGAGYLPKVIENDRAQFQSRRTLEDYIAIAASDARLRTGREMLSRHARMLDRIEARYGVQKEVIVAIWGMESSYGDRRGSTPVISALSTLGYKSRRAGFFEGQLVAALAILQSGDISPAKMTGSWAGAMGHTQFIPTTYQAHAVDFTGDGRRDIWSDDPTDALASAANYLAQSGWQAGRLWGVEVRLPSGSDDLVTRSVADWRARGVTRASGGAVPDHGSASLILPSGAGGPAFLLFHNYKVFRAYNNSMKYALGVGHLADRLAGGGPLVGDFGTDAQGLTLEERKEIQTRLTAAGFDTEGADGVIGDKTTAAIRAFEQARGHPVTGIASQTLLRQLRG
ncbi:lytic murein transglycosylase [Maritimibacter sp. HL-12]|uniref:lytic murein transglycosylase n=1 Tax=Maritimibacter sp. HL-12 TaxID=1162418 RepID=UPI000A0EF4EE|nr:lytic murein transglycosylase [Maritimibacter sp. HL-12]SMH32511.1 lytic murein transglycosylase [Maritimibacter sp. HL-12]